MNEHVLNDWDYIRHIKRKNAITSTLITRNVSYLHIDIEINQEALFRGIYSGFFSFCTETINLTT